MPKRSSVSLPLISLLPHLQLTRHSIHFLFKETHKQKCQNKAFKHLNTDLVLHRVPRTVQALKKSGQQYHIPRIFLSIHTRVFQEVTPPMCLNWQNLSFISHLLWVLLVSKFEAWSCKKNSLWSTRACMLFSQAQHPCFFWILLTITTQLADQ